MISLSRAEAQFVFLWAGWRWADPRHFDRLRNYEIEEKLDVEVAGVDRNVDDPEEVFVIAEPCPFNGRYCRWGHT